MKNNQANSKNSLFASHIMSFSLSLSLALVTRKQKTSKASCKTIMSKHSVSRNEYKLSLSLSLFHIYRIHLVPVMKGKHCRGS